MRRMCECGLHYRSDRPYPKLVELDMLTEAICTSATDPIAKETNHATYVMGRRYGSLRIRIPEWVLDAVITVSSFRRRACA